MGKWPSWNCQLQLLAKIQLATETATLPFAENVLQILSAGASIPPLSRIYSGWRKAAAFFIFPLLKPFSIVSAGQTDIKTDRETQACVAGRELLKYSVQISLFDPNHLAAKTGRKWWFIAEMALSSNIDKYTRTKASETLLRIRK